MTRIRAVGAITPMGDTEEEIWNNLEQKTPGVLNTKKDYTTRLSSRVRRRNSRFADLAATAAINCYDKYREENPDVSNAEIGCILSTDYGPLETNMEFAKQIVDGDPDACSPTVFSNTVHNACLGTIAIDLKITGPNTMLMGSDPIDISDMIMAEDKAKAMICGGVEEYSDELKASINKFGNKENNFGDVSVVFAIDNNKGNKGITILDSRVMSGVSAVFEPEKVDADECTEYVKDVLDEYNPDVVICSDTNEQLQELEKRIINDDYKNIKYIDNFKDYFGTCLGAELPAKMMVAKAILEHGYIPNGLRKDANESGKISKVAVLSTDITGNYYCKVLGL